MTWVAWRRDRTWHVATVGVVAALIIALSFSVARYGRANTGDGTAGSLYPLLIFLPGLLGLLLGSHVGGHDLRQRTTALAWTQSVDRRRWIRTKLLLTSVVVTAAIVALLPGAASWARAFRGALVSSGTFDMSGIVLIGYTLFAVMLGACLATALRRPRDGVFLGIVPFLVIRFAVATQIRSRLVGTQIAPVQDGSRGFDRLQAVSWITNSGYLPRGQLSPGPHQTCTTWAPFLCTRGGHVFGTARCAAMEHLHFVVEFHPESQYWILQGMETAIFGVMAYALYRLTIFVTVYSPD